MAKATGNFALIHGGRNSGPPATQAEIAAVEFSPLNPGTTKERRLAAAQKVTDEIYKALVLSLEIGSLDKDALIAKVREGYEAFGSLLLSLTHTADNVRLVQETIMAAETRLAVAFSVIEPEEEC